MRNWKSILIILAVLGSMSAVGAEKKKKRRRRRPARVALSLQNSNSLERLVKLAEKDKKKALGSQDLNVALFKMDLSPSIKRALYAKPVNETKALFLLQLYRIFVAQTEEN